MPRYWVVLGGTDPRVFQQDDIPIVTQKGKNSPPFLVYIQCHTSADAAVVFNLQRTIETLSTIHSDRFDLARSIEALPEFARVLEEVSPWWVVLNGNNFKGILLHETDLQREISDYTYNSYRKAYTFKEALLLIVRCGIRPNNRGAASVTVQMSQLSLSSALGSPLRLPIIESPPCPPGLTTNPTRRIRNTNTKNASGPSTPTVTSHGPGHSSTQKPPTSVQSFSATATVVSSSTLTPYKHIRNTVGVVGTITDPSGVTSNITKDISDAVGLPRAEYLDAHGFGSTEIEHIADAYSIASSIDEFISLAAGCGMAVTELEWFWAFSSHV